jgi:hypothetical protein
MAGAALRDKNSYRPQAPAKEEETERASLDGSNQRKINAQDLPFPNCGLHLKGWLSS